MIVYVAGFVLLVFFFVAFPKLPMYQQIISLVLVGLVVWGLIIPALQGSS